MEPEGDELARARIETDLATSFLVEAGAGTGKTTTTVRRIVHAVRTGQLSMPGLAAITFTKKAGLELRQRIGAALLEAMESAVDPAGLAPLERALGELEQASIGTIHSFCSSVLREWALEAGLDPGFTQAEGLEAEMLQREVLSTTMSESLISRDSRLLGVLELGAPLASVLRIAEEVLRRGVDPHGAERELPEDRTPLECSIERLIAELGNTVEELSELLPSCLDPADRGAQAIRAAQLSVSVLRGLPASSRAAFLLGKLEWPAGRGRKANWKSGEACQRQKELFEAHRESVIQVRSAIGRRAAHALVPWLAGLLKSYEVEKARRGVVDFQDLLTRTARLLREKSAIRQLLQSRFTMIAVDEFQDTDRIQTEIIFLLAGSGGACEVWQNVAITPGKLLLVGDPKQSIYRFRGADIETYEAAKSLLARQGEVLHLTQNFRSAPGILDTVNKVFGKVMRRPSDGAYQPDHVPLISGLSWSEGEAGPALRLLPLPPVQGESVEAVRHREASTLTAALSTILREGWLIRDPAGGSRPCEPRDIAILFKSSASLEPLLEALGKQGLLFSLETGQPAAVREELWAATAALRAIEDPGDARALVVALRGPQFGVSDEELLLHLNRGGRLNALDPGGGELGARIRGAFELLARLHVERNRHSPDSLLALFFELTAARASASLSSRSREALLSMDWMLEVARQRGEAFTESIAKFTQWMERRLERSEGGPDIGSEEGALTLLSIHKAKGLEFPIVALFDPEAAAPHMKRVTVDPMTGRWEIRLGSDRMVMETEGFGRLVLEDRRREEAEALRLLYVAMTRARDTLLITGRQGGRGATLVGQALAILDEGPRFTAGEGGEERSRRVSIPGASSTSAGSTMPFLEAVNGWKSRRTRAIADAGRGLALATASARLDPAPVPLVSRRGVWRREASTMGKAVHRVMELVDLEGQSGLDRLVDHVCRRTGCLARSAEVASMVRGLLASAIVQRARRARSSRREVPFCVLIDGVIREGAIDLMFEEEGELVLVDFKTEAVDPDRLEEHAARHRPQALFYAEAAAVASGLRVREFVLVFARTGIELPIEQPLQPSTGMPRNG